MNIVKRITSTRRIGRTPNGFGVDEVRVKYADGTNGVFYRLNPDDGRIFGLQSKRPVMCEERQAGLFEVVT